MNENDPTQNNGAGWADATDSDAFNEAIDGDGIRETIDKDILDDIKVTAIKDLPEAFAGKPKGTQHRPAMYAAKKRKRKIALQKAARKRQRGK